MKIKILILAALLFFVISSCNQHREEDPAPKAIAVKTITVSRQKVQIPIHRSGILATSSKVRLSFKIGGLVDRLLVDEGDAVSRSQLLASLNLAEIRAQVNLAQSNFEKAARDLKRIQRLYADSVATLEQQQDLKTVLDIAEANLRIAEFNLMHAQIFAPANGRILKRFAEENELVSPGTPIYYFGSSEENFIVRLGVTDRDIVRLQIGDSAAVHFDTYPGISFPAFVSETAEAGDPMSGTFEIEITLTNYDKKLISGFVAKVDIFPAPEDMYFMLPQQSLVEADLDKAFVFIVSDSTNRVRKIPVSVGPIINDQVAIISGLDAGQRVVVEGSAYLSDRSLIEIVD